MTSSQLPFYKISSLIKRFSIVQLPDVLRNVFGDETWEEIKSNANLYKINLVSKNEAAEFCSVLYQRQQPTREEFYDVLLTLIFLACLEITSRTLWLGTHGYVKVVGLHMDQEYGVFNYKRRTWNCFLPTNKTLSFPSINELEQRIIQAYRKETRDVRLFYLHFEDLMWVMTVERKIKKKGGVTYGKTFHFVFDCFDNYDAKYIFYQPEMTTNEHPLQLFCQVLGYENYRHINLSGKDITGMFKMLHKRQVGVSRGIETFEPSNRVVVEGNVMDFTLGVAREDYAKNLFQGLSCMKKFEVHARNEWRGKYALSNESIGTQLTFRTRGSKSVQDLFKELLKHGNVALPLPSYIKQFSSLKRNVVQIKQLPDEDENDED